MPKLPVISGRQLVRVLGRIGFVKVSQSGSHIKMHHPDGRTAIIPDHKILKKGTLKKGILNPLSIHVEDLIKLLR
jgi:predicted RNA binding protein YcfA (HicA-like mRNA interferase family)